jgi:hypothetical protein
LGSLIGPENNGSLRDPDWGSKQRRFVQGTHPFCHRQSYRKGIPPHPLWRDLFPGCPGTHIDDGGLGNHRIVHGSYVCADTWICPHPVGTPCTVMVIDDNELAGGRPTHKAQALFCVEAHIEQAEFYITNLGSYGAFLGVPWLRHHNPDNDRDGSHGHADATEGRGEGGLLLLMRWESQAS